MTFVTSFGIMTIMNRIIIKTLLFVTGIMLQLNIYGISEYSIVAILMGMSLIGSEDIANAITGKRSTVFVGIIVLAWCIAGYFYRPLCCYIPLLAFLIADAGSKLFFAVPGMMTIILLITDIMSGLWVLLLAVAAVYLQQLVVRINELERKEHFLRDESVEQKLLMEKSNRNLRDSQDAQITAATLKERNRIAREIHDNVGHMLTRSILQMGAIRAINKDELLNEPLATLSDTLNEAMTNIRSSVHDLHDDSVNLESSLREIADEVEGFEVSFEYDLGKFVPKDIKYCFLAITKEAVNNAVKYSNGNKLLMLYRNHPGFYQMLIEDNGTSISENEGSGIGLINMRERVQNLGGSINIRTDNGFRILITIMKKEGEES